jgi:type VI secretion system protein ImpH
VTTLEPIDVENAQFFGLVSYLQQIRPEAPLVGSTKSPANESIRFKAHATLSFPAAEVASVEPSAERPEGLDVRVNLIGLYGPSSPLPVSVTERVIDSEGANALGDFLDLFNHRLAGLLYLVWRHYRHFARYEPGARDPMSQAFAALFGLPPDPRGAAADPRRVILLPYAGLLSMYSRSALSIAQVIGHFFAMPVRIEEFVARWIDIPKQARFALGSNLPLGTEGLLGDTMRDIAGHFRVWSGPIPFERYTQFLPGRADHASLRWLVDLVVRDPLARDLGFVIEANTAPEWSLGVGELGWTTWTVPDRGRPIEVAI